MRILSRQLNLCVAWTQTIQSTTKITCVKKKNKETIVNLKKLVKELTKDLHTLKVENSSLKKKLEDIYKSNYIRIKKVKQEIIEIMATSEY